MHLLFHLPHKTTTRSNYSSRNFPVHVEHAGISTISKYFSFFYVFYSVFGFFEDLFFSNLTRLRVLHCTFYFCVYNISLCTKSNFDDASRKRSSETVAS